MGLDIHIRTDKDEEIFREIDSNKRNNLRGTLSRSFLRLIFRQHEPDDEELSQISEITGIDLKPLLDMGLYPDPLDEEYQLSQSHTDIGKDKLKAEINEVKERSAKSISEIIEILEQLDTKLKRNSAYYKKLLLSDNSQESFIYFENYSLDTNPNEYGFISHNDITFGVDIRTMLEYLKFAKTKGATKTYFNFG